jgi:hypothetical protein
MDENAWGCSLDVSETLAPKRGIKRGIYRSNEKTTRASQGRVLGDLAPGWRVTNTLRKA